MSRSPSLQTLWTSDDELTYEYRIAPERPRMAEQIISAFEGAIPERTERMKVSEWAERKRILPSSLTPKPGPFRWRITPYMREIADCFSEDSPVRKVAVRKASHVGFTVAVLENVIGYIIDCAPGPTMFVSADKGVAETSVELRIDAMLESAKLSDKIAPQVAHQRTGRKSGDTKSRKDFPGGFLMAIGPNVGGKLRSFSIKNLFFDELDAYPKDVGGGEKGKTADEGNPIRLAEQRTVGFERVRKILYGSTPLIKGASEIDDRFLAGDQRYYEVPCRHCGHFQVLRWRIEHDGKTEYPLKYEKDELGRLIYDSVYYECESCGGHLKDADKAWMFQRGRWVATAEPTEPGYRSYHLSALYSPVGERSWESICQEWISCREGKNVALLRPFVNLTLGESFEERGEAPAWPMVKARSEGYEEEVVTVDDEGLVQKIDSPSRPERALFCTAGVDVQADRLECEIVAWGREAESWSLGYHVLPGDTSQLGTCWRNLRKILIEKHSGMPVLKALVDSGFNQPIVYRFCSAFDNVLPSKGDDRVAGSRKVYQRGPVEGAPIHLVRLEVGHLKLELYSFLRIGTLDGKPPTTTTPGYCHFPVGRDDRYFRQLTAEDRRLETTRTGRQHMVWHLPSGARNEALDCRVAAMGALYVFAGEVCEILEMEQIEWPTFWNAAEKRMGLDLVK